MLILSERWCLLQRRELEELLRDLREMPWSTLQALFDERVERLWADAVDGANVVADPKLDALEELASKMTPEVVQGMLKPGALEEIRRRARGEG